MADYAYIENYSRIGKMGIQRKVFEDIAAKATNRIKGASVSGKKAKYAKIFDLFNPIQVVIHHDGKVDIKIAVSLKAGVNVNQVCTDIQKEVKTALEEMIEQVKVNIIIKVAEIKAN